MPKILIIDDSQTEVRLAQQALSDSGFFCLGASSGVEGERLAEQEKPDVILLDIVMEGQDGFQTCRKIKKNPTTAHIPIILVSSKNSESDKFWGMKQGASEYITKPYDPAVLSTTVRKYLKS
jgi:twitching motility two-component system response regulator PilH